RSEQLPCRSAPGRGLPPCVAHAPARQLSAPLQNKLSVHAEPLGSGAVHVSLDSLQLSAQLPSPSGPGQGSPVEWLHVPPAHVSVPLQNNPSVHADPLGSGSVQSSADSLQLSAQSLSPSGPLQGLPVL